jgi:hypothetical protein
MRCTSSVQRKSGSVPVYSSAIVRANLPGAPLVIGRALRMREHAEDNRDGQQSISSIE